MANSENLLRSVLINNTTNRAIDCIFGGLYGAVYVAAGGACPPVGAAIAGSLFFSGARSLYYIYNHVGDKYSPKEEQKEAVLGAAHGASCFIIPFASFVSNMGVQAAMRCVINKTLPDIIDGKPIANSKKHQIEKDIILEFAIAATTASVLKYASPAVSVTECLLEAYDGLKAVCKGLIGYESLMVVYQRLVRTNEGQDLTSSLEHLIGEENNQDLIGADDNPELFDADY